LRSRRSESQHLQRADLGSHTDHEGEKFVPNAGFIIVLSPFLFEASLGQVILKFPQSRSGNIALDFVFLDLPGDPCGLRDERTDAVPVGSDDTAEVDEDST